MAGKPTFLVLGAQKAGTTWLAHMTTQHPEIGTPGEKELHFFDKRDRYRLGLEWYEAQFPPRAPGIRAMGEFTPNYLWVDTTPEERRESGHNEDIPRLVRRAYPDLRLVVSLRDPVTRAISAYYHLLAAGYLPGRPGILEAAAHRGILSMGQYARHLHAWFEHIPRDHFLILVYEEDIDGAKAPETLQKVFRHIGVREDFRPGGIDKRHNARRSNLEIRYGLANHPVRHLIRRLMPEAIKNHPRLAVPVTDSEKNELARLYRPYNEELAALLGRRLPW